MALIQCAQCKRSISSVASACIHCGAAMPGPDTKPVPASKPQPVTAIVMDDALLAMHGLDDADLLNGLNEALLSMQAPASDGDTADRPAIGTSSTQTFGPGDEVPAPVQALVDVALENAKLAGGVSSSRTYGPGDAMPEHVHALMNAALENIELAGDTSSSTTHGSGEGIPLPLLDLMKAGFGSANQVGGPPGSVVAQPNNVRTEVGFEPAAAAAVNFALAEVTPAAVPAEKPEAAVSALAQASAVQSSVPTAAVSFSLAEVTSTAVPASKSEATACEADQARAVEIPVPAPTVCFSLAEVPNTAVPADEPGVAVSASAQVNAVQPSVPIPPASVSMPDTAEAAKPTGRLEVLDAKRPVPLWLGLAVFMLPPIFVWFLLRKGHTTTQRVVGFSWLGLIALGRYASTLAGS